LWAVFKVGPPPSPTLCVGTRAVMMGEQRMSIEIEPQVEIESAAQGVGRDFP